MPPYLSRRLLRAVLVLGAFAALPASAAATTLELRSGRLEISGDAFANAIRVGRVEQGFQVTDTKADLRVEAPAPCFLLDDRKAECRLDSATPLRIAGAAGADSLQVDANVQADAELLGDNGTDELQGGGGDDRLLGDNGADEMDGGDGLDTATYDGRGTGVTVTLDGAFNDGYSDDAAPVPRDAPALAPQDNVRTEKVIGTALADVLVGDDGDNVLKGLQGADEISGLGGDDNLDLGSGSDRALGGDGDDLLQADDGQPDRVGCGNGKNDFAAVDLQDFDAARSPFSLDPPSLPDCEHLVGAPVRELPNADVRSLRAAKGGP